MVKSVTNRGDSSYQMATSHLITTCATLAALILFVLVGAKVLPSAIGMTRAGQPAMVVAFLLNIAIILFGYRRANDLNQTLSALKAAEQEALDNAYTDHTTGLGNRRTILRELERAFGATIPRSWPARRVRTCRARARSTTRVSRRSSSASPASPLSAPPATSSR